jgi:hypothetical protein
MAWITGSVWVIIIFWLSIVTHELGHYIAAKSLGLILSHVEIGAGKLLFRFTLFHDNWRIYSRPIRAFVVAYPSSKQWKNLLMFGAGPLASFLMALALWWWDHPYLALFPLYDGATNCFPFRTPWFDSDGYNIRKAWRRRNEKPYPKYLYSEGN